MNSFGRTSTILGKEVEEHVLEDVRVRAGYLLGNLFVLLIQNQYILSNFISSFFGYGIYFILFYCQAPYILSLIFFYLFFSILFHLFSFLSYLLVVFLLYNVLRHLHKQEMEL